MNDWKFIKPDENLSLQDKMSYTEGYFTCLCQIHSNLSVDPEDKEFNKLNIEIKKYMEKLKL